MNKLKHLFGNEKRPKTIVRDNSNGTLWTYERLSIDYAISRKNCLTHSFLQKIKKCKIIGWRRINEYKEIEAHYNLKGHTVIAGGTYKVKYLPNPNASHAPTLNSIASRCVNIARIH